MRIFLIVLALVLSGCGKDSSPAATNKNLFSVWTDNGDGSVMDLTSGSFGLGMIFSFVFAGGEICSCQFTLIGTQASGSWTLAACTYQNGSGGGVDPGCAAGDSNGTYTKPGSTLTVCTAGVGTCSTHR